MEITFAGWHGNAQKRGLFIRMLKKYLVPAVQEAGFTRIRVYDHSRGGRDVSADPRTFSVVVNGAPAGNRGHTRGANTLWGRYRTGRDYCCRSCSSWTLLESAGGDIIKETGGAPVASVTGNCLYLLWNIHHDAFSEFPRACRDMFGDAAGLVQPPVPTLADIAAGPVLLPESRTGMPEREILTQAHAVIRREIARADDIRSRLAAGVPAAADADAVLRQLCGIPEIARLGVHTDAEAEAGFLEVTTHTMYCRDTGRRLLHEMGRFRISLRFGPNPSAVCRNLTRTYMGYGHPHVDRGGDWCMGEAAVILNLLRSYEPQAAILLALKAIESLNPQDSTADIMKGFPVVAAPRPYPPGPAKAGRGVKKFLKQLAGQAVVARTAVLERELSGGMAATVPACRTLAVTARRQAFAGSVIGGQKSVRFPIADVSATVSAELDAVRGTPGIGTSSLSGDRMILTVPVLSVTDTDSGLLRTMGPFTVTLDSATGTAFFVNDNPLRAGGEIRHAPHVESGNGEAPVSPLTLALPELLGGLRLEAAARLCLEYLTEFRGSQVPREWMDAFKKL